jgi:chromate transporter
MAEAGTETGRTGEILRAFLRLGLTSFGGPVAHIGYFHAEFVERRRWLDAARFAELTALCQFLPGPASSQLGLLIGLGRGGWAGAAAAWLGFTAPSAILMILFAYGLDALGGSAQAGWLAGLKAAAVAVVAQAVWTMAGSLAPDRARRTLAVAASLLALLLGGVAGQLLAIALGAAVGLAALRGEGAGGTHFESPVSRKSGATLLIAFFVLLAVTPILAGLGQGFAFLDAFYRAGSLVFGGGHVVLPLLQAEVVTPGWVSPEAFVAGYGAAQALPGPLFAFSAYLGAVAEVEPNGVAGALICLVAIFLPAALLAAGALPFWEAIRARPGARAALAGINAAVVGLLLAALYDPVWTQGVASPGTFAVAACALLALSVWKVSPVWVVLGAAVAGAGLDSAGLLT